MTLVTEIAILVLAGFVGFAVISKIPNTLHTPLMSGTNAIHGLSGLTGPRTAVRGNLIAAVGMAIAVVATLLTPHIWDGSSTPWLIVLGLVLGIAIGIPAARRVRMTAMPQMVALFNGVGRGAVFPISWTAFRLTHRYSHTATYIAIFSLFAAIVGSVSFWGSNIAFGKLQEILPGRPITLGAAQQAVNLLLLALAIAAAVDIAAGDHSEGVFIGMLVCAALLGHAVVPGYGMAVAQAQHAVRELTKELEARGVEVSYAIHPVAGRMPGHMNVLLAEADVPYDQLREMDDANPEFQRTDVSLVIGANDVTNPAAKNTPSSPIYGMPILEVADSRSVIVIKRSMNPGFAGIENELYYDPKTAMLFGDAKSAVSEITAELAQL